MRDPRLRAVVICPSNPFISIEPILAVPGMREAIATCDAPVVAVSPIIGGRAVKGPTAKMMTELGLAVNAASAALRYGDLLDGYVRRSCRRGRGRRTRHSGHDGAYADDDARRARATGAPCARHAHALAQAAT